jgi:hypothetical protein|tara:strand:+ start:848 stop:1213 length:366 start_codon:yes stop_codon:yes gene_type:complete
MATKNATVNSKAFKRDMKKLTRYIYGTFANEILKDFKKETPRDTGNARRKTKKKVSKGNSTIKILTNYPYGAVLDEGQYPNPPKQGTGKTVGGYSTQAPKGMTEPTLDKARKRLDTFVRKL